MSKFVIITDSSSELTKEQRDLYQIDYVHMGINYGDKEFPVSLDWEYFTPKEFYDLMRNGVHVKTSQVNKNEYFEKFSSYLKQGYDILSLSCSAKLSSSYFSSLTVRDELLKEYPERKIICMDTKNGCFSLGMLCMLAGRLQKEGYPIEKVAQHVEENLKTVNMLGTVGDLTYLKRAGRVSTMSAVFGGFLQIKPIIISDIHGSNLAVEKPKGRAKSLERVAEMVKEIYVDHPDQIISVAHCDCEEDAKHIVELIKEKIPNLKCPIQTPYVGQIVGASTGPESIVVTLYGKKVTYDGEKK